MTQHSYFRFFTAADCFQFPDIAHTYCPTFDLYDKGFCFPASVIQKKKVAVKPPGLRLCVYRVLAWR